MELDPAGVVTDHIKRRQRPAALSLQWTPCITDVSSRRAEKATVALPSRATRWRNRVGRRLPVAWTPGMVTEAGPVDRDTRDRRARSCPGRSRTARSDRAQTELSARDDVPRPDSTWIGKRPWNSSATRHRAPLAGAQRVARVDAEAAGSSKRRGPVPRIASCQVRVGTTAASRICPHVHSRVPARTQPESAARVGRETAPSRRRAED